MSSTLTFRLNNQTIHVDANRACDPLLDFIREDARRTGTKEGCRSGECGACIVLVHRAGCTRLVNSCIATLGQVAGAAILSVEGLTDRLSGALHPAQHSMIDQRAAQCGFCTPGIVMALALASAQSATAVPTAVLSGNLCRCTGYRPIIDAARQCCNDSCHVELFDFGQPDTETGSFPGFESPDSLAVALELRARLPDATVLAGGTDLVTEWRRNGTRPNQVLYLGRVQELQRIDATGPDLSIGAGVSIAQAVECLLGPWPEAADYLRRFGSPAINTNATIAGNLQTASPIGDLAPLLMVLNARVIVQNQTVDRSIPVDTFVAGYRRTRLAADELITRIVVPPRPERLKLFAYKVSRRFDQDLATLNLLVSFQLIAGVMRQVKVAIGGLSKQASRLPVFETACEGQPPTLQVMQQLARTLNAAIEPITDVRGSARYRRLVAQNLLTRLALDMNGDTETNLRLVQPT